MERSGEAFLERLNQKKTDSVVIKMLKRKTADDYHQMLPYDVGEYEPKQSNIDSEHARELFIRESDKMVVKRRFERIYNMMEC